MNVEIPQTPEQEEIMFLKMIQEGTLFLDTTFESAPSPLTIIDILYRKEFGMDVSHIRPAVPGDIPKIREFYQYLEMIAGGIAK